MNAKFHFGDLLTVAACFLLVGCAGSGRPETAPVRGTVTYNGQPVAGASVAFLCPGAPRLAVGTTDEAGNYQLTTFVPNDGAVMGTHVVTVNKYVDDSGSSPPPAEAITDSQARSKAIEAAMQQAATEIEQAEQAKPLLPKKYSDRVTSDLRAEVVDGPNVIDLQLKD
jgi:hypothetical protein